MGENLPRRFRDAIRTNYLEIAKTHGAFDAEIITLSANKTLQSVAPLLASNDNDLCEFAKQRALECFGICSRWSMPQIALTVMQGVAARYGIEPPKAKTPEGARARLLCELWWRRQLRRIVARKFEHTAISLGLVSKIKGKYVSDETLSRRISQVRRNKRVLESITATNDEGDTFTLAELAKLGISNPSVRTAELVTRMRGFDAIAKAKKHTQLFITITAPSKFHAVHSHGKRNEKYNEATPKEAQEHLTEGFALSRAALAKKGIKLYGFRVVEPHQDGTPHWHMALNVEHKKDVNTVIYTLEKYALREDGEEKGAAYKYTNKGRELGARFDVEVIDGRGATGYLLKYILKNINPSKMHDTTDFEGGDLMDSVYEGKDGVSVSRVEAWAACWGIRQFQQIGGAPVGVWRELRRLGAVELLEKYGVLDGLQYAADKSDWAGYTELMGGVVCKRKELVARVWRGWQDLRTKYDGYGALVVEGVEAINGNFAKTRLREWVLSGAKSALGFMSITVTEKKEGEIKKDEIKRDKTAFADAKGKFRRSQKSVNVQQIGNS